MTEANPFPDETPVLGGSRATSREKRGSREAWPWLPGTVLQQCGPDEWQVCVEVRELAYPEGGELWYPCCIRDAGEAEAAPGQLSWPARAPGTANPGASPCLASPPITPGMTATLDETQLIDRDELARAIRTAAACWEGPRVPRRAAPGRRRAGHQLAGNRPAAPRVRLARRRPAWPDAGPGASSRPLVRHEGVRARPRAAGLAGRPGRAGGPAWRLPRARPSCPRAPPGAASAGGPIPPERGPLARLLPQRMPDSGLGGPGSAETGQRPARHPVGSARAHRTSEAPAALRCESCRPGSELQALRPVTALHPGHANTG